MTAILSLLSPAVAAALFWNVAPVFEYGWQGPWDYAVALVAFGLVAHALVALVTACYGLSCRLQEARSRQPDPRPKASVRVPTFA